MERFEIWEGHMESLEKKVKTIKNKCNKFGCEFRFEKVGEVIKEVEDRTNLDKETGKPRKVFCKFIVIEAEGTAVINGWKFVASVEHTEKGNIFSKALTDVEIPIRYRSSNTYCEHCNSNRRRNGTFVVMDTETGEFKQVGKNCLKDYTHGMSAQWATYMASIKAIFEEAQEEPIEGGFGFRQRYYETDEILRYTAETIRRYGFSKSNDGTSTKNRVNDFLDVSHGYTRDWMPEDIERIEEMMKEVGFNPDSEEAKEMTKEAKTWIENQEAKNDYIHNLKVVTSLKYTDRSRFGLLVSLFPTWNRELEVEAKQKAEKEAGKASEYVGNVGEKVVVDVESVKCLTSWKSCFNGYRESTTYIWKIVGTDGNVYTWKTSKWMNEDNVPSKIVGTVKEHKEYREVKQTELTRCKMEYKGA